MVNGINIKNLISFIAPCLMALLALVPDVKHKKIPNAITFPAIIAGIVYVAIFVRGWELAYSVTSFVLMLLIGFIGVMGMGDVKMFMAIGLFVGLPMLLAIMSGTYILAIVYTLLKRPKEIKARAALLIYRHKPADKESAPVAPFCFAACVVATLVKLLLLG